MGQKTLWKDDYYFDAYELAKEGCKEAMIAKMFGISLSTFLKWESKKRLLRMALIKGRRIHKDKKHATNGNSIEEYIYKHLSDDERKIWKKIMKLHHTHRGVDVIKMMMEKKGKVFQQHLLLHAIIHSNFSITKACSMVGLSRQKFETWKNDPDFCKMFHAIQEAKKEMIENHFLRLVRKGEASVIIHGAKTICRDMGYGDKQTVDVNVSGTVNHNLVQVDVTALPLETQQILLDHIRKSREIPSAVIDSVPKLPAKVIESQIVGNVQ